MLPTKLLLLLTTEPGLQQLLLLTTEPGLQQLLLLTIGL
jgi:hypothetical protein